jgi:AAA family ATP:ADP antiporter
VLVTSAVSGLRMLGWGVGGLALLGTGVAAMAAVVARRAGWSPDLAPEDPAGRDGRDAPPV